MPLLSKRAFALSNKANSKFKMPLLNKENIDKILNTESEKVSKKKKFDTDNISNSSSTKSRYQKKAIRKSVSLTLSIEQTNIETSKRTNATEIIKSPSINQSEVSEFDRSKDDMFDDTPKDDSGVSSFLTQEFINRPDIKDKYLKHWDETFPKDLEDDFWQFSQEWMKDSDTEKRKKNVKDNNSKSKQKKGSSAKKTKQKEIFENILNEKKKNASERKEKNDQTCGTDESLKKNVNKRTKKTDAKVKISATSKETSFETREELYQRMIKIQESRNVGLYVYCDSCNKARYLPDTKDPLDLPTKWYCHMNPDSKHNKCDDPEEVEEEEEFLIHNLYNAGSIVWAKMDGYPWWPAMVEDDPDTEDYFWLEGDSMEPTWYHVTFFDSYEVTRAWLRPAHLKPFKENMKFSEDRATKTRQYKTRLTVSVNQAVDACALPLLERLRKYSFIQRYKKPLVSKSKKTIVRKKSVKKVGNGKIKEKMAKSNSGDELSGYIDKILENIISNDVNQCFS